MNVLLLSPVTVDNLPALAGLERACFPDPWSEGGLRLLLAPPYGGLCAWQGGEVVGYIGYLAFPAAGDCSAEAEITRLAVAPAARRQGIGRALLMEMLTVLQGEGSLSVRLDVRESNVPARALYASLGFAPCGRRPRFYGGEDAIEYLLTYN